MAFRVGQKCVCVDDEPDPGRTWKDTPPRAGQIYTVARTGVRSSYCPVPCLKLRELPGWKYRQTRFRPVVSTDTGMAILEQIRRDVTNKELRPICHDEQV